MPIDMASVYADRFKASPQILQAAVLGQAPIPGLDPYTALRSLQLIKESQRMQMAQAAQQPTQAPSLVDQAVAQPIPQLQPQMPQGAPQAAPQSEGLAGMPAGAQGFAPGGIVSFANGGMGEDEMPSIEAPSAGGGGGEDASNPLLEAIEAMEGSPGSPVTYQQLSSLYPGLIRQIMAQAPKGMTAAERAQFVKDYIRERQTEAGESPFKALREEIATARGERAKNLDRAQGVALLQAAQAALQPGGTMRGLAGAASAFGGAYGQALQADRAERRSLANMEMNIADAERKERMGMYGEARAAAAAADKDRVEASRAHTAKMTTLANLVRGGMQATKPTTGRPPSQPKLPEQTRADILADLLATEKPNEGESQDAFKARMAARASREALGLARTSDIGPGKQQLGYAELFRKIDEKADAAETNFKKSLLDPNNKRWRELSKSDKPEDQAAAKKMLTDLRNATREFYLSNPHLLEAPPTGAPRSGGAKSAPAAGAARPAPPAGFDLDQK